MATTFTCPHCGDKTSIVQKQKVNQFYNVSLTDGELEYELKEEYAIDGETEFVCSGCEEFIAATEGEIIDWLTPPEDDVPLCESDEE